MRLKSASRNKNKQTPKEYKNQITTNLKCNNLKITHTIWKQIETKSKKHIINLKLIIYSGNSIIRDRWGWLNYLVLSGARSKYQVPKCGGRVSHPARVSHTTLRMNLKWSRPVINTKFQTQNRRKKQKTIHTLDWRLTNYAIGLSVSAILHPSVSPC